jgi:hypothetical protein
MKIIKYLLASIIILIVLISLRRYNQNNKEYEQKVKNFISMSGMDEEHALLLIEEKGVDYLLDSIYALNDSLYQINLKENESAKQELERIRLKEYYKTPAGKINKKYPKWTAKDCQRLVNKEIWIGMEYEMLVYRRGKPNTINVSNYGKGDEYQWCWDDFEPSCFYGGSDGIITAYN